MQYKLSTMHGTKLHDCEVLVGIYRAHWFIFIALIYTSNFTVGPASRYQVLFQRFFAHS